MGCICIDKNFLFSSFRIKFFTKSAWADSVQQSRCPSVCFLLSPSHTIFQRGPSLLFWCESVVLIRALKKGMCSGWLSSTLPPPQRGPSPHFCMDRVRFWCGSVVSSRAPFLTPAKTKISVLLSASVESIGVSRMRIFLDFFF